MKHASHGVLRRHAGSSQAWDCPNGGQRHRVIERQQDPEGLELKDSRQGFKSKREEWSCGVPWCHGHCGTVWKLATGRVGSQVSKDPVNPTRCSHILRKMEIH